MPEWYLFTVVLGLTAAFGFAWKSLLVFLPFFLLAAVMPIVQALRSAAHATFVTSPRTFLTTVALRTLTAALHLMQPAARLRGRLRHGLTPWRKFSQWRLAAPWPRTFTIWSERWRSDDERLTSVEADVRAHGALVTRGGDFDHWDLEVRAGVLTAARIRMAVEEHGSGRQFVRFRTWPRWSRPWALAAIGLVTLSALAGMDQAWKVSTAFALLGLLVVGRMYLGCATAMAMIRDVLFAARVAEENAGAVVSIVAPDFRQPLVAGNGNGNGNGKGNGNGNGSHRAHYPSRKVNTIAREAHDAVPEKASRPESEPVKIRKANA